jgi:hypothetical protein
MCVGGRVDPGGGGGLGVGTAGAKGAPCPSCRGPTPSWSGGETIHMQGVNWPADDSTLVAWECDSPAHPSNPAFCDSAGAVAVRSNGKGKLALFGVHGDDRGRGRR